MKYRLFKTAALTSAFIFACSSTTFAGTWTHNDKDGYNWDSLWFYVKDDGSYAQQEWIADSGTWYWIDDNGYIPVVAGISSDGFLYNSKGIYVPTNDGIHHFVDQNMYGQLHEGMTANEVNAVLGQPHELSSSSSADYGSRHYDYASYYWYSSNTNGSMYVSYTNGIVTYFSAYWN